jgi:hypothetical protein
MCSIWGTFGPALLERYPDLWREVFELDRAMPDFVRMRPSTNQKAARDTLRNHFKAWSVANGPSTRDVSDDGSGRTSRWGSEWTRERHETFPAFFDDEAIAAHDLSVAWA